MLPAAPELSSAAFYIAAGNYRKKTKRDLNWQEMEMDANTGSFTLCSAPCAAKMRQIHALFTRMVEPGLKMDYTYLIILRFFRGGKGAYEG